MTKATPSTVQHKKKKKGIIKPFHSSITNTIKTMSADIGTPFKATTRTMAFIAAMCEEAVSDVVTQCSMGGSGVTMQVCHLKPAIVQYYLKRCGRCVADGGKSAGEIIHSLKPVRENMDDRYADYLKSPGKHKSQEEVEEEEEEDVVDMGIEEEEVVVLKEAVLLEHSSTLGEVEE